MGVTGTNFSKVYTAGAVSAEVPAVSEAASTKVSQEASTNTAEVVSTVPDVGLKEVPAAGAAINTEDIADAAAVFYKVSTADTADVSMIPADTGGTSCSKVPDADITLKVQSTDVNGSAVLPNTTCQHAVTVLEKALTKSAASTRDLTGE